MPAPKLLTPKQIIVVSGGGNYIVISSMSGATLTCGNQSYTLGSGETSHVFSVDAGTYTCTASMTNYYDTTQSVTISSGQVFVTLTPSYLPTTYQQVEYLRSTGTQYIDTGQSLTDSYRVEINYRVTSIQDGTFICGVRKDSNSRIGWFLTINNSSASSILTGYQTGYASSFNNVFAGHQTNDKWSKIVAYKEGADYKYDLHVDNVFIDSQSYTASGINSGNYSLFLLWANNAGTGLLNKAEADLGAVAIADGTAKLKDLVPCYRKSDSVLGMYDKVSDTFLTNSGTGTFTAGPDVN